MGYNLLIGQKYFDEDMYQNLIKDGLSEEDSSYQAIRVKYEEHEEAPAFGEPTDYSNERMPSYTVWYNVCRSTSIFHLFFKDDVFKGGHPGHFHITKEWLDELNKRIRFFEGFYRNCEPTYDEKHPYYDVNVKTFTKFGIVTIPVNHVLCRLEWLKYWCNYAHQAYGDEAIFVNS